MIRRNYKYAVVMVSGLTVPAVAAPGALFQVSATGNLLNINTTIPNHFYPGAGLTIPTNCQVGTGDCVSIQNNVCLFPVSQTQPHSIASMSD
jgi:hypothetical protein